MAKIKLDLDSDDNLDFERTVQIPDTKGKAPIYVPVTYKYRSKIELGELYDSYRKDDADDAEPAEEKKVSIKELFAKQVAADVEMLMDMLVGWGLDYEFNSENLTKFVTKYGGAARAISDDYRDSILRGHLGNSKK